MRRRSRINRPIGHQDWPQSTNPFSAAKRRLLSGKSAVIGTLGDSTGYHSTEKFGRLGVRLGDAVDANVLFMPYNSTDEHFDGSGIGAGGNKLQNVIPLRTSSAGARYVTTFFTSGFLPAMSYLGAPTTGDLSVQVRMNTNWRPAQLTYICGKQDFVPGAVSFEVFMNTSGVLSIYLSADGSTWVSGSPFVNVGSVAVPWTGTSVGEIRVDYIRNDGAGHSLINFYYRLLDGDAWTQLGTTRQVTQFNLAPAASSPYWIGSNNAAYCNADWYAVSISDIITNPTTGAVTSGGVVLTPFLPERWNVNTASNAVISHGGPNILVVNGNVSGQNIAYLNDASRKWKLNPPHGQDVIILNNGHNETVTSGRAIAELWVPWIQDLRYIRPDVPLIQLGQNPVGIPGSGDASWFDYRPQRMASIAQVCAANGVGFIDTYQAYTDPATMVRTDFLHPTYSGADTVNLPAIYGSQAEAEFILWNLAPELMARV